MEKQFVLVHGSCFGAWCWYKLVAMLKSTGHKVTALDLAASGRSMKQLHQVRTISDYSQPLIEFMEALPAEERVVLVGHSMGGLPITIAMERFSHKIAAAVFIAAFMPGPHLPFLDIVQKALALGRDLNMDSKFTYDNGPEKPATSVFFGPKHVASMLFQQSPPQDSILGTMLMRPAPLFNDSESLKGLSLTEENWGSVSRVFVVCGEDPSMAELVRLMIEENPPDEVYVLDGADHMPMCSKTSELCSFLAQVADKYS